jgi:predicted DNA-binding protein
MGRPRINEDHTPARLPAGTLDRIEAVLRKRERRADFIREAIERELKRREKSKMAKK